MTKSEQQTTRRNAEPLSRRCPRCKGEIAADAPLDLCPHCLLDRALAHPAALASVGEYDVLEVIGTGGMGVVYKARQRRAGRLVALKTIRDGTFADAGVVRRFIEEAQAAARLDHPNIVPIYDVGEYEGRHYFTMKLLQGGALGDRMAEFRDVQRAAELVAILARAVEEGHRCRVLHRDLKPENILFDDRGQPYIVDFGIAKLAGQDGETQTGAIVGTASYMAPEQARGHGNRVTPAADVWSLGVILYELLTGERPFAGPTPMDVLRRCLEDEPTLPRALRRGIPRDVETICLTCLNKEPERRYGSAAALAHDLERYLRGQTILARRPGPVERAFRWSARHPVGAGVIMAAIMILATMTTAALSIVRAQEQARRQEVLATNVHAARALAGATLSQLTEYAELVEEAALDPRLIERMTHGNASTDICMLDDMLSRDQATGSRPAPFSTWFVLDRDGALVGHCPRLPEDHGHERYAWRDYFIGATRLANAAARSVYVSRVYRSEIDHRFRFALSTPLYDAAGAHIGVLTANIATDSRFGVLELDQGRRTASLAGPRDRDREQQSGPLPDEFIILVRDGIEAGEGYPIRSDMLSRVAGSGRNRPILDQLRLATADQVASDGNYHDPFVESGRTESTGPWLAGFAPVGNTGFVITVQTRFEDAVALDREPLKRLMRWALLAALGGALIFVAAMMYARQRTRHGAVGSE